MFLEHARCVSELSPTTTVICKTGRVQRYSELVKTGSEHLLICRYTAKTNTTFPGHVHWSVWQWQLAPPQSAHPPKRLSAQASGCTQ
jgi:hypothetical protein